MPPSSAASETEESAAGSGPSTIAATAAPTGEPTTAPAAGSSAPEETPAAGTDVEEPDNAGGSVDVVTTYFGWDAGASAVLIGGYVTGVLEDGGTCTATLTQGGRSVTGTSNVTITGIPTPTLSPLSGLTLG